MMICDDCDDDDDDDGDDDDNDDDDDHYDHDCLYLGRKSQNFRKERLSYDHMGDTRPCQFSQSS